MPPGNPPDPHDPLQDKLDLIFSPLGKLNQPPRREIRATLSGYASTDNALYSHEKRLQYIEEQYSESLMLRSLLPAFDGASIRRVYPFCLYLERPGDPEAFLRLSSSLVLKLDLYGMHTYPVLKGSLLFRQVVQKRERETYSETEASQFDFATQLAKNLQAYGTAVNVNFITIGKPPEKKDGQTDWSEKLKNFSEALKNLMLVGTCGAVLLGGTFVVSKPSAESPNQRQITVVHTSRKIQLEVVPKILDVQNANEFKELLDLIESAVPVPAKVPQEARLIGPMKRISSRK